jgi:hypothetical protein
MMLKYFYKYSGGVKDVIETLRIFTEAMQKFVIAKVPLPELERIRDLFEDDPVSFLEEVKRALTESEDTEEILAMEEILRKLQESIRDLAHERGIILVLGTNGAKESKEANEGQDPLEYRALNILHVCVEKLAALLAYKRHQIELTHKRPTG